MIIVDGYKDRERRKLNLIFHKIPESTDTTKRREDDKKFVSNVIKEIGVNNPDIINTEGSPTVAKSRTLLLKSYLKSMKSLDF